jgi:hypothetical protein
LPIGRAVDEQVGRGRATPRSGLVPQSWREISYLSSSPKGDRGFESCSLQRRVVNEPHIAIKTYLSTGIRLAFSPGVRDASKLAMGEEEFIETLPPDLREDVADLP